MKSPKYPICCSVFLLALLSGFALTAFGQRWEQLSPLGSPPSPRSDPSAAYDPSLNRLIVFGGRTGINVGDPNVYLNDVWVLTNANGSGGTPEWMELHPTGDLPAPRDDASVVYDASSNTLILFGGHRVIDFNDVHVLSNANGLGGAPRWTRLSPTGSELPHTRRDSPAVYDVQTNRMIVFGGNCIGCAGLNDTWVLTNANGSGGTPEWIRLNTGGTQPPPGGALLAALDPATNRMTIFGVLTFSPEVWVLENANGLGGNAAWSLITPAGVGPSTPRTDPEGGVDLASGRMIVYGGQDWLFGGAFSDSWVLLEFNGLAEARWVQVNPVNAPPPARYRPVGAYDQQSNRLIVFGGSLTVTCCSGSLQPLNDVWVLSNANGIVEIEVSIDIKPGSDPNSINLRSRGRLPVAILGSSTFDVTSVDVPTVRFAGAMAVRSSTEDVNGDGSPDLVLHFLTQSLELAKTSTEATLTGMTVDGNRIKGKDSVAVVP